MTADLKPCPVCPPGIGRPRIQEEPERSMQFQLWYAVACDTCDFRGPSENTERDAAAAWNRRASPWQPIETAPKDRVIDGWQSPGGRVFDVSWGPTTHDGVRWRRVTESGLRIPLYGLTHWMPLPEPPDNA